MTFGTTEEMLEFAREWRELTAFVKESAKKRGVNLANYIIVLECGERRENDKRGVKNG